MWLRASFEACRIPLAVYRHERPIISYVVMAIISVFFDVTAGE